MNTTLSGAVSTAGVATAFVMLLNSQVLAHNHIHLTNDDLGYALVLVNALAHCLRPLVGKLLAKVS